MAVLHSIDKDRLILRCPTSADAAAINAAIVASWPELSAWMEWAQGEPPTLADTIARTADREADFETGTEFGHGIFERTSGAFVGMASLFAFDWQAHRGEVGYWLATSAVGRGFATEAVRALTELGGRLGLERLELRCDAKEVRPRAVAGRAGYSLERVVRDDCWRVLMPLCDTFVYGISVTAPRKFHQTATAWIQWRPVRV